MLPSGAVLIAWVLFVYVLLYGIRYLLGARIYLTCALREDENRSVRGNRSSRKSCGC